MHYMLALKFQNKDPFKIDKSEYINLNLKKYTNF